MLTIQLKTKMMNKLVKFWMIAILAVAFYSCDNDDLNNDIQPPNFEVLQRVDTLAFETVEELQTRFGNNPSANQILSNDITAYKLVYKTKYPDGEIINASGLVIVPKRNANLSIVCYQHGTLSNRADAPSNYPNAGAETNFIAALFASNGYLLALPDYIGYGESEDLKHPYEHAESTATSSYDFLEAVKEFTDYKGIGLDDRLFLAGYSQGGFSTMALTKLIEENHIDKWTITAAAPGAGAYHKTAFAENIMSITEDIPYMDVYLWVLYSYNWVYGLDRPWSYYLLEPYASEAEARTDGPFPVSNNNPQEIFTEEFLAELADEDSPFITALKDNNRYDWRPTVPMRLYHGTTDDYVPPFNSQDAYDAMNARGAEQVELRLLNGKDHFTSPDVYFPDIFLQYFKSFYFL